MTCIEECGSNCRTRIDTSNLLRGRKLSRDILKTRLYAFKRKLEVEEIWTLALSVIKTELSIPERHSFIIL